MFNTIIEMNDCIEWETAVIFFNLLIIIINIILYIDLWLAS